MDILRMLLQGAPQDVPEGGADIPVTAPKRRRFEVDDTRDAPNELKREELIPRKGMFGLKGTMRDVVGLIGDAFLAQAGRPDVYRPQREREKLASALYGYKDDPMAAAERVGIDNPEMGYKMYDDIEDRKVKQAAQLAQQAAIQQRGYSIAGSYAKTLNSPEKYARGRAGLQAAMDRFGLGTQLPEEYDEEFMTDLFTRGLNPDQIADNERADRNTESQIQDRGARLSVTQQRAAEAARHNRAMEARPTAGRAPSRPTASNVDAEVLAKIKNGTASPNEKAYYESRLARGGGKGGGGSSGRRAPPTGGFPPGFDPSLLRKVKK